MREPLRAEPLTQIGADFGLTQFSSVISAVMRVTTRLQAVPPLYAASVLAHLWVYHLGFSLGIGVVGSHVPHKSLCHVHAAFMPATAWPVSRFPPGSSQVNDSPLSLRTGRSQSFQKFPLVIVLSSSTSAVPLGNGPLFGTFFGTMLMSDFSTAYTPGLWSQTFPGRPAGSTLRRVLLRSPGSRA